MRKIFLDELPRKMHAGKECIDWINSVGHTVSFIYDDIKDEIKFVDYKNGFLYIKYKENPIYKLYQSSILYCNIGCLIKKHTGDYKIKIGTKIIDDKRDLIITDREKRTKKDTLKYYKYVCQKCLYTGWIREYSLLSSSGCACCAGKVVIRGINDISTTHPEYLKYFYNIEDAYNNTYSSANIIKYKCPDCGFTKMRRISDLNNNRYRCQKCSDGISYPEKYMMSVLSQLNIEYMYQFSKTNQLWCKKFLYDFAIPNLSCIIEVHGAGHYCNSFSTYKMGRTLTEEQNNDKAKEKLAIENNIDNYIIIDAKFSNSNYIKKSILDSLLPKLLNFKETDIDWNVCHESGMTDIMKSVCKVKNENPNILSRDLAKMFKLNSATISRYLKNGSQIGLCKYNPSEERNKGLLLGRKTGIKRKHIKVFKNNIELFSFNDVYEICNVSEQLFGEKFSMTAIRKVCTGTKPTYKGYIFKYFS